MKKTVKFIIAIALLLCLVSCSGFSSSYKAVMLVKSERDNACSATWSSLDGTLVLNTVKKSSGEGSIHFTASLEEGKMTVYYYIKGDSKELKQKLFELSGGETIDDRRGYVENGNKVQIIIETDGKIKGGEIAVDFE